MGKIYRVGAGVMVWSLERCEEMVLLDAWLRAKRRIPASEHWTFDLEYHLFDKGDGISERHLASMNRHLRRIGAQEVQFAETNPTDYIRKGSHELRRKDRLKLKEMLEGVEPDVRAIRVAAAWQSMNELEPAYRTYEQWRATFRKPDAMPARRITARPMPTISRASTRSLPTTAVSLSPSTPEFALKLLEHTTDPAMKKLLVRAVMEAFGRLTVA